MPKGFLLGLAVGVLVGIGLASVKGVTIQNALSTVGGLATSFVLLTCFAVIAVAAVGLSKRKRHTESTTEENDQ